MHRRPLTFALAAAGVAAFLAARTGRADGSGAPSAASIVRALGAQAAHVLAPHTGRIGALVQIPARTTAAALGLQEIAPGIGRLRGSPAEIQLFSAAHPDVHIEVGPPLHMLLDKAGQYVNVVAPQAMGINGTGTLVGVADVGLDVTHPDFLDANGHSRVAWLLDLSLPPMGLHPDLESMFSMTDSSGNVTGAVLSGADIDMLRAKAGSTLPQDEIGHGTHVSSIACGNGGISPHTVFVGMAPSAGLIFARVAAKGGGDSIEDDAALLGVEFLFNRADAMNMPIAVNFSLGKDFGPHDGSTLWEQSLASFVGPSKPGHAFVAAAGNSGDIVDSQVHQSVFVSDGTTVHVPITTGGATDGGVQVWITTRGSADISIGLDAPDGTWISPVSQGTEQGYNQNLVNAGVINGSNIANSPVPAGSHGAVVIWSGQWGAGTYDITLSGHGTADLYLQPTGDAATGTTVVGFVSGVREGTVDLPATNAGIIAVGCSVSKPKWTSLDGGQVRFVVPLLDAAGGIPDPSGGVRDLNDGEVCYFSGAGPTVTGVPKPEIAAPGAVIAAAMSSQATPGTLTSIFTNPGCPPVSRGGQPDPKCMQVDATHAVNAGTSMAAPMVTGAIALLFQEDPTLTQDKIVPLLQAGAHRFRAAVPYPDQGGPGELDILGALDALNQTKNPALELPSLATSWLTLSADYFAADGSTPIVAIYELRTADGQHRADGFDASRFVSWALVDGQRHAAPKPVRVGPGVWTMTVELPAGLGGSALSLGATFDGKDIVVPETVPIATDVWAATYPDSVKGGCTVSAGRAAGNVGGTAGALGLVAALSLLERRRRR